MIKFSIFNFQFSIFGKGFTFIELLVIVGILSVLAALAVPALRFFEKESDLNNTAEEIISSLKWAQAKTLASKGASRWGVYFSTSTSPQQYTLFKGSDYDGRDPSFDDISELPAKIEIYEVNIAGGAGQTVFERISGATDNSGALSLRLKDNPAKTKTIYIESSGRVGLIAPSPSSDANRLKDSRHTHFDYSRTRTIATTTENLVLTFEGGTTETIVIADNIQSGQIDWEGEVSVAGSMQKLKIHTHRLNDAVSGSQFCVHRDRRYSNKSLSVTLSGDGSGAIIQYSADGLTTSKTSIYASEPIWQ